MVIFFIQLEQNKEAFQFYFKLYKINNYFSLKSFIFKLLFFLLHFSRNVRFIFFHVCFVKVDVNELKNHHDFKLVDMNDFLTRTFAVIITQKMMIIFFSNFSCFFMTAKLLLYHHYQISHFYMHAMYIYMLHTITNLFF